ncbi:hypothetical protein PMIN03_010525 [Paraphaeosphaeria minitans]
MTPAASPKTSSPPPLVPGRNLKVDDGTQATHVNFHALPLPQLDALEKEHNWCRVRKVRRLDFEDLVANVMRHLPGASNSALEAAVSERLRRDTSHLKKGLEVLKREIFLNVSLAEEIDDLMPLLQHDTQLDFMRYTIQTLSVLAQLYSDQPAAAGTAPSSTSPRTSFSTTKVPARCRESKTPMTIEKPRTPQARIRPNSYNGEPPVYRRPGRPGGLGAQTAQDRHGAAHE